MIGRVAVKKTLNSFKCRHWIWIALKCLLGHIHFWLISWFHSCMDKFDKIRVNESGQTIIQISSDGQRENIEKCLCKQEFEINLGMEMKIYDTFFKGLCHGIFKESPLPCKPAMRRCQMSQEILVKHMAPLHLRYG